MFNVDAKCFRKSNNHFVNTSSLSEGCSSVHTQLSNPNSASDDELYKVSFMNERFVCESITNEKN